MEALGGKDGVLWFKKRLCVPKQGHFRRTILDEAHNSAYSIHPGTTKMYLDLKEEYWWNGMKGGIARFVAHLWCVQKGQGRAPEAQWITLAVADPSMEVGWS